MIFGIIQITKGRILCSGVDQQNLDIVSESICFIREKYYITHFHGEGVAFNGTNSLKGSFLKGGLERWAMVTIRPYLYIMIDLANHYGVDGCLCKIRL